MNSNKLFKKWRQERARMRQHHQKLSPYQLAKALSRTPLYTIQQSDDVASIVKITST